MKVILKIFVILISLTCVSQTITGKAISITDGDTFKLLTKDNLQIKIRLANIDCPETKQPFSTKAKQFTADAIFGKSVKIEVLKTDRYGRYIANVFYNNNRNLSYELVKQGLAWHYIKYSNDKRLNRIEDNARQKKTGLWKDPNSIPPWEWRANKKKKSKK